MSEQWLPAQETPQCWKQSIFRRGEELKDSKPCVDKDNQYAHDHSPFQVSVRFSSRTIRGTVKNILPVPGWEMQHFFWVTCSGFIWFLITLVGSLYLRGRAAAKLSIRAAGG